MTESKAGKRHLQCFAWSFAVCAIVFAPRPSFATLAAHVSLQVRKVDARGVELSQGASTFSVQMLAPGVLRVHCMPRGRGTPPDVVIDPHQHWSAFRHTVSRDGDRVVLRSAKMVAEVNAATGSLSVTSAAGRPLLEQTNLTTLVQDRITLQHAADDALYGVGGYEIHQSVAAGLLKTGEQVAKAGKQGHAGAPLVWSTSGYALLVDGGGANFDLANNQIIASNFGRPDADYYILVGAPLALFGDVAEISGHAQLFPEWSLGFINSQWGIDQTELMNIVKTYREKKIPLDMFILDFDWKAWGHGDYGEFRWNSVKFPDGQSGKLARQLDAEGVHLGGIMKPRILVDSREGRYATTHGLWLPREKPFKDYFSHKLVNALNFDLPVTRTWFGDLAMKYGFDSGMRGWWNDEDDEFHSNTQFLNMQRSLYEAQRRVSNLRVWSINRNFWLGSQRYAYGLWSGDIDTGFASMARQRTRMLSAIDVGEMNWAMDGGGFNGHPSDENYARWIEFDAFAPIMRVHGTLGQKRQPWRYGRVAQAAAVHAIDLRYRLLPYIYAYQYTNHTRGVGLVRPLTFDWPADPEVRNDVDAWMFGRWLLVSPVVRKGATAQRVYLPPGAWIGWANGKHYAGGTVISYPVNAKTWRDIPLFIRAGAIIPTQPVMQYVGQHPASTITVEVFPTITASHFDYYADDGDTYAYEKGVYYLQPMMTRRATDGATFALATPKGSYKSALRWYVLAIHDGFVARTVEVDGKRLPTAASRTALEKALSPAWFSGHDRYGNVAFVKVRAAVAAHVQVLAH